MRRHRRRARWHAVRRGDRRCRRPARLRAAKRFDRVEVRKRFASIADPSQIALVIIVDEGPVKIVMTGDPDSPTRVVRKRLPNMLILPILSREDGYGITYGARLTLPDPQWMGKRSRRHLSADHGGARRQAAIEHREALSTACTIDRVTAARHVSAPPPTWPTRQTMTAPGCPCGASGEFARALRLGATTGWQRASFEGVADQFAQIARRRRLRHARRSDPRAQRGLRPCRVGASAFGDGPLRRRDAGWLRGLPGIGEPHRCSTAAATSGSSASPCWPVAPRGSTRIGRCRRTSAAAARRLEHAARLRVGSFVGDTLVAMSAELVQPLTSPVTLGKLGVTAFVDRGTVYNKGERFGDQTLQQGSGAGVWFAAAFSPAEPRGRARPRRDHPRPRRRQCHLLGR